MQELMAKMACISEHLLLEPLLVTAEEGFGAKVFCSEMGVLPATVGEHSFSITCATPVSDLLLHDLRHLRAESIQIGTYLVEMAFMWWCCSRSHGNLL